MAKKRSPMDMYADKRNSQLRGDKAKLERTAMPIQPRSAMKGAKPESNKSLKNTGAKGKSMTMAQAMGKSKMPKGKKSMGGSKKKKKPSR